MRISFGFFWLPNKQPYMAKKVFYVPFLFLLFALLVNPMRFCQYRSLLIKPYFPPKW